MEAKESIEIPFGAFDSELKGWEYTIPEGMEAEIKDGKIIVKEKENEDERIRKEIIDFLWEEKIFLQEAHSSVENNPKYRFVMDAITWLEKQGEQKPTLPGFEEQEGVAGRDYIPVEWVEAIENYGKWKIVRVNEENLAWSEKDNPYYDDICEFLINLLHSETADVNKDAIQKDLDWLNSLKERYTWKPSDEQIE